MSPEQEMSEPNKIIYRRKPQSLGLLIRMARRQRGLTQARLAQKAGISAKAISMVECGRRGISWATLSKIMEILRYEIGLWPIEEDDSEEDIWQIVRRIAPDLNSLLALLERVDSGRS